MAGGDGARLRPLTVGRPKPMVPIVNKPVMGHILDLLKHHGITEVVVTLRYLAAVIQDFFGDGSTLGMKITYVVEDSPLGTAGSVKNAAEYLDETFLVISGDALTDFDLTSILVAHKASGAAATLTLTHVPNPLEYGVVVTDEAGYVAQFLEKPGWGEIISDTVNTGIYVLEPAVLALIPPGVPYDFASDLFPYMLEQPRLLEQEPLYGYIAQGYWCDVGNLEEYRRANADLLYGRVQLPEAIGHHLGGGIWVGEGVEIAPSAQLFGPVYLGDEVKIKADVQVYGPSVIRANTVVDNYTRVERTLIWRNSYIGESCELRGVIICRQCSLKPKVFAYEGVVIGDDCALGEGSVLHPDVKLWPHKQIEAGATIKESIIWGAQGRRSLFNRFGISGMVNVDLTPEYAAKLSAALGATLPKGSYVAVNRDAHRSSRMLKRALISGLLSAGVNVLDLGAVAIPVARYFVRSRGDTTAGIHVRISPFDQRVVDIRIMNAEGMNQSNAAERNIERSFFREDFRRAYLDEIGVIEYPYNTVKSYIAAFRQHINVERIRQAGFKIVVDYSHGLVVETLADILIGLGVDVVPLNARMNESKLAMLQSEFHANQERMAKIVQVLEADIGIQFDVGGEKIFIVDEQGNLLDDITAAALMVELALFANPGQAVAGLITLPTAFDVIASWHNSQILRISNTMQRLMSAAAEHNVLLAVDGTGNFIFPEFQPAVDGMMAAVQLLALMAIRQMPLSQVVAYLPAVHLARAAVVCPWEAKGRVMRLLNQQYKDHPVENVDGLKIHLAEGEWVHLAPNPEKPQFEVIAEGKTPERANALVADYRAQIEQIVQPR